LKSAEDQTYNAIMVFRRQQEVIEMKLSEAFNQVVSLDRKIQEYYNTELPKRHPNYPLVGPDDEEPPPPPEEKELEEFLRRLPDNLLYQLRLISDFNWGRFQVDELAEYYHGMKENVGDREELISEMMWDKAVLADVLEDGLEKLGRYKITLDNMPLKKVKARKQ
jgi:hypothetical protein